MDLPPVMMGTSFARWRAEALGLDYQRAFSRLCGLGFEIVRLSTSWHEVDQFGYDHLDWLMREAEQVGQRVVLTVGMKALGWPEFYLPPTVTLDGAGTRRRLLAHVARSVQRYRDRDGLIAWQIENEPFNRSGPLGRVVERSMVRAEANLARSLDGRRPIAITTFAHFDQGLDRASRRLQAPWRRRLHLELSAEREALAVLHRDDILGLDVYRAIGQNDGTSSVAHAAGDQLEAVTSWRRIAAAQGKRLWIMEAQAEPWEPTRTTHGHPVSVQPDDVLDLAVRLRAVGPEAILLWGSEYWLWREDNGDPRWMEIARRIAQMRLIS